MMSETQIQLALDRNSSEDFADLVACHLTGELSDGQQEQLNAELVALPERRDEFVAICVQAHLFATCVDPEFVTECLNDFADDEDSSLGQIQVDSSPSTMPLGFVPTPIHANIGYFSSGWPVAYLVATVIFGIGALVDSLVHVSQPAQVVRQSSLPVRVDAEPKTELVGRITGMVDCRWAGTVFNSPVVPFGRKYELASGLMEITYNTGAKVILQGPVTYEVESKNGGFLPVGKLTGKVATASAKGFSVRTPTATVTDLGTEFGVEVNKNGTTRLHVLQGVVETKGIGRQGADKRAERVVAGTAIEIGARGVPIMPISFAPQSFARKLPTQPSNNPAEEAYIRAVLVDRPMGYWPLNERSGERTFLDRSGNGLVGYAMNKVEAGQPGPFGERSRALELNGDGYVDLGRHDEFGLENNVTVEAWVWIDKPLLTSAVFSAVGRDEGGRLGWMLCVYSPESFSPEESLGGIRMGFVAFHSQSEYPQATSFLEPDAGMPQRRWTHMAMVYDRGQTARLYRNGKCIESKHRDAAVRVGPTFLTIGWLSDGHILASDQYYWRGRLAHVAVYPQALGAERIQEHFLQKMNAADESKKE